MVEHKDMVFISDWLSPFSFPIKWKHVAGRTSYNIAKSS